MKKRITNLPSINAISNIILQLVTMISGFVIPRLILEQFGSETNGLVNSLNQMLNYVTLLEGGLGSVIMTSLYKPLLKKDYEKIGKIVNTASSFYKRISYIFIIYSVFIGVVFSFSYQQYGFRYVFLLTIILASSLFIQYNLSIAYKLLLNADQRIYIVSSTQSIIIIINMLLFIIGIRLFPSIHLLKLGGALLFIAQPIVFKANCKRYGLEEYRGVDNLLIANRWNGFGINIAAFVHGNTDILVLTILTKDLGLISVYGIYNLVANGLKQIITAISGGVLPYLGRAYSTGDVKKTNETFLQYEFVISLFTFFLFTVGIIMIVPFVKIYTLGINDADYVQPLFGTLLLLAEGMFCLREPYVNISYVANKFKEVTIYAIIEAVINIAISMILVGCIGLSGVALGTLISMTFRTIFHVIYAKTIIKVNTSRLFIKKVIIYGFTSFLIIYISKFIAIPSLSILNWIVYAFVYSIITGTLLMIVSMVFFRNELSLFIHKKE